MQYAPILYFIRFYNATIQNLLINSMNSIKGVISDFICVGLDSLVPMFNHIHINTMAAGGDYEIAYCLILPLIKYTST